MLLTRGLPLLIELGLAIFALIECVSAPAPTVRNLPKWGWILLIVVFPFVGAVAWLVAGRPVTYGRSGGAGAGASRGGGVGRATPQHRRGMHPIGPDDDPEFLWQLGRAVEQRRRDEGHDPEGR